MNKYYLEVAADLLAPPLYYSQVHRLTRPFYAGFGQILMFHRVLPSADKLRIHNHKSLEVTPEYLEDLISYFRNLGYDFISLDELNTGRRNPDRKMVVFTFDDGYADNYTYAYPVFKRHGVPFTIYVTTGMPDGTANPWWYFLEDFVVSHEKYKMPEEFGGELLLMDTAKRKEMAFNRIRDLFASADEKKLETLVQKLLHIDRETMKRRTEELALTWAQIVELSNDPLVTIGSHTINHLPLNSLSHERSQTEIVQSKQVLEHRISKPVTHFCYPLGSYGPKEIGIMKESGYKTATTINMANLFPENLRHPFALPRIMINSLTDRRILTLQLNGLLPALRNKFKRVVI